MSDLFFILMGFTAYIVIRMATAVFYQALCEGN